MASNTEAYDRQDFVAAVDELETATTSEVKESIGCSRTTAWNYLKLLVEAGELTSNEYGGTKVYEVANDE